MTVWGVLPPDGKEEIRLAGVGRPEWYQEKGKEVYAAPAVMDSLVEELMAEQGGVYEL